MQSFAARLQEIARKARYETGLTLVGAALKAYISPRALAYYIAGTMIPTPEKVVAIAQGYREPQLMDCYCNHCCPIGCMRKERREAA